MSEFDNMGKDFPTLETDHDNAAYDEFDKETESQVEKQRIVDSRTDEMWQNRETVCRVIEATLDIINHDYNTEYDVAKAIEKTITYYMEVEIEEELGL